MVKTQHHPLRRADNAEMHFCCFETGNRIRRPPYYRRKAKQRAGLLKRSKKKKKNLAAREEIQLGFINFHAAVLKVKIKCASISSRSARI